MGSYRLGFRSLTDERDALELPVDESLPTWLDGVLFRNGPGRFEVGGRALAHWFDGLAMVRRFGFEEGSVTYTNRFLRTDAFERTQNGSRVTMPEFGTGPRGLLSGLLDRLVPTPTDNTNVNVQRVGQEMIARTETPRYTAFDPVSLETHGEWSFDDDIEGHLACAHPVVGPGRGQDSAPGRTFNLLTGFGRQHEYLVTERQHGSTERSVLARIETDHVGYMHSFVVTASFVILIEPPLHLDLRSLLNPFSGGSFLDSLSWRSNRNSRFIVIDREDGTVRKTVEGPPFFYFHQANAFDTPDGVAIDLVTFEDASVLDALSLDDLSAGNFSHPMGDLTRFSLSVEKGSLSRATLHAGHLSLPRINEQRQTRAYEYVFAQGAAGSDRVDFPTGLRKIRVETGAARAFDDPDLYCGEPVFVPRPAGDREDDGVVLSVVLDTETERSGLLVLDGETFEREAIAWLPHILPFDFHGQYYSDGATGP